MKKTSFRITPYCLGHVVRLTNLKKYVKLRLSSKQKLQKIKRMKTNKKTKKITLSTIQSISKISPPPPIPLLPPLKIQNKKNQPIQIKFSSFFSNTSVLCQTYSDL